MKKKSTKKGAPQANYTLLVTFHRAEEAVFNEAFLEAKGLDEEQVSELGEKAIAKLLMEYDSYRLGQLKTKLKEFGGWIEMSGNLKEVKIDASLDIGFLFKAGASLAGLDHIFRRVSQDFGSLHVTDFTSVLTQGYEDGEYDTGSISQGPDESYFENISALSERLSKHGVVVGQPSFQDVPVWRLLGEFIMRFKNGALSSEVPGVSVVFDGYGQNDDGEDTDIETYQITLDVNGEEFSFYAAAVGCESVPRVDWQYTTEIYEEKIGERIEESSSGITRKKFEATVRDLYLASIEAHMH